MCDVNDFPMIVCEVPHQLPVKAYVVESESRLYEIAQISGGDNWEFPGHFDDDENWVDETTVDDMKEAIAHDLHICYFISECDYDDFYPVSPHQGIRAKNEVKRLAGELGWSPPWE